MGKKGRGSVKDLLRSAIGKGSVFDQAPNARKRHTVIGDRNRNSKAHSQTQARERSDQIRRETLLIEHQQRGRTNVFHDGRFGEEEEGMPLEDKLVHRFQRERQRQLRASKYALGDGPEGGDEGGGSLGGRSLGAPTELTHGGRALGDMDDFSDADLGASDDERDSGFGRRDDADAAETAARFGGGEREEGEERPLTAKEALEDTIARYKLAKFERQDERKEQNKLVEKLDEDFEALRGLIFQAGNKANKPAISSLAAKVEAKTATAAVGGDGAVSGATVGPEAYRDFEKLAFELKGEMSTVGKAQPSDRMQTEEELATAEVR